METITKQFADRLTEFLDSECDDFGLSYNWRWCGDTQCCVVTVKLYDREVDVNFIYVELTDELEIEFCEDSWYTVEEFGSSVKYFWILISPKLFPNNG